MGGHKYKDNTHLQIEECTTIDDSVPYLSHHYNH